MDCERMGETEFTVRFHVCFKSVNGDGGKCRAPSRVTADCGRPVDGYHRRTIEVSDTRHRCGMF